MTPGRAARDIGARTVRGMAWAYGSYVGGRALVLVATAILARLLSPEDFGLVALALVFTALLETMKDMGVNQALVVADDRALTERAQTAWSFGIALGGALTVVTAALGPSRPTSSTSPRCRGCWRSWR